MFREDDVRGLVPPMFISCHDGPRPHLAEQRKEKNAKFLRCHAFITNLSPKMRTELVCEIGPNQTWQGADPHLPVDGPLGQEPNYDLGHVQVRAP